MAAIRHQPGGSKKMNAKNKTSYPRGQLVLTIYEESSTLAVLYELSFSVENG